MNISSFTSDERALLEPNNDIIATALVVIGFIVFAAILSKTFIAFNGNSQALENYEQAAMIASDIASYPPLQGSRQELISADTLEVLANPSQDPQSHYMFFHRFSSNLDFYVEVRTDDGNYQWIISEGNTALNGRDVIASSVPVVIELGSNARCEPGTITVKLVQNGWS
ncbi:hypothetical protein SAMN04488589_1493 [Methanolobus vulcani]|uniref:Uncharacterized protein n=1 Tax=Methanolobus vulcani TaxID=38026 RepID=A0A7Z7FCM9_9EURY|nr:hypothetical protein [Methanolobus vulcani]SDF84307.1 hypothetical protein SAMN04488589_1493 [Methanolobus vulcani]